MTYYYRTMKPPPLTSPFFRHETHLIPYLQSTSFDRRKPDLQLSLVSSVCPWCINARLPVVDGGIWCRLPDQGWQEYGLIFPCSLLPSFSCPFGHIGEEVVHISCLSIQSRATTPVSSGGWLFFFFGNRFCHDLAYVVIKKTLHK